MASLVFFRQQREDGGVHMGLEVDGVSIADRFDPGDAEPDAALAWFVDLRCDGPDIAATPQAAWNWLAAQNDLVTGAFRGLAERLRVGLDPDVWPVEFAVPRLPPGLRVVAVCSCVRRVSAREMGDVVGAVAKDWPEYFQQLRSAEVPSH